MISRSQHPLFIRYQGMLQRCYNPRNPSYKHYGARGVAVCQEWRDSFWSFVSAVGQPPTMEHTLERVDNDGEYCPGNVRWATRAEQNRNKSTSRFVTINGVRVSAVELAKQEGVTPQAVYNRLSRTGSAIYQKDTCGERRKAVQVSLRPSIYAIATNLATEHGTFPGRIIERALMALAGKKGK